MHRVWLVLLGAVLIFGVRWMKGRRPGTKEMLFLVFNVLINLITAGVLAIIGYGVWVVFHGSVVLFGKVLYTLLAGVIGAGLVWGNVFAWKKWAETYRMRTLRRKAASRLYVVRGGKAEEPQADDEKEAQQEAPHPDGED